MANGAAFACRRATDVDRGPGRQQCYGYRASAFNVSEQPGRQGVRDCGWPARGGAPVKDRRERHATPSCPAPHHTVVSYRGRYPHQTGVVADSEAAAINCLSVACRARRILHNVGNGSLKVTAPGQSTTTARERARRLPLLRVGAGLQQRVPTTALAATGLAPARLRDRAAATC